MIVYFRGVIFVSLMLTTLNKISCNHYFYCSFQLSTQAGDPDSVNAKKKAAKKAEKAAKKAAHKAQTSGEGKKDVDVPALVAEKKAKVAPVMVKTMSSISVASRKSNPMKLQSNQICYNPNVPLIERPVVALTMVVLTNSRNNYDVKSDHNRHSGPALGLSSGGELTGDMAIARYVTRNSNSNSALLGGSNLEQVALVDSYVDYAQTLSKFQHISRVKAVAATLNNVLAEKTYVVGQSLTIADVALFASIGFPAEAIDAAQVEAILGGKKCPMILLMHMVRSHPAIREATQLAKGLSSDNETVFDGAATLDPLVEGMNPLEGATIGNVCTRFPPEPSGYLHIGHAKVRYIYLGISRCHYWM